jgi:hypothetical protein
MLHGYGWCVLRSSREPYRDVAPLGEAIDRIDDAMDKADSELCVLFERWMDDNATAELRWAMYTQPWSRSGVLSYYVARNHRASCVWNMLGWNAEHGPGSYGLLYVHDDEDLMGNESYGRGQQDYSKVFRVHRLANGRIDELADPFLSPHFPRVNPSNCA